MSGVPPYPPADLQDLASRLTSAPVHDELALEGFHQHLQSFRSGIGSQNEQLLGCLDAASTLIRSLMHLGDAPAEDVRSMVVRLLSLVHDEASSPSPRGTQSSVPPALPGTTSAAGLATINGMALGEVMVQLGLITPEQIDEALRRQTHTGKQFGVTLVELGYCSMDAVRQGLNLQKALTQAPSKSDAGEAGPIQSILLGETLIGMGKIDRSQLEHGLAFQKKRKVRIGAALVALGIITWPEVAGALHPTRGLTINVEDDGPTAIDLPGAGS